MRNLLVVALLLSSSLAQAAPWHVAAGVGTDFPAAVGAGVELEGPGRVRLSTSLGIMPRPYVQTIDAFLVGIDAYDQATADLVESSLASSLVWRTHVGWRPWPCRGLYVDAGYGLVTLGGSTGAAELVTAVTGQMAPAGDGASRTFDIRSTLHMLDVEVGWRWLVAPHWRVGVALGGAFTFAATTQIEPQYTPRNPAATERFTSAGEAYLDDVYTSYVFTPVLSVRALYEL